MWWAKPESSVGTGPFKLSSRLPKISMDFAPVSPWWGGSTGPLQRVHLEIVDDPKHWIAKYEAGGYDLVGYGGQTAPTEDLVRYSNDPQLRKQLTLAPVARSTWVAFGFKTGPFAGIDAGRDGRRAFSLAINRAEIADQICARGTLCVPATGGLIPRGLQGHLGDNQDPNARFDPAMAKSLYDRWDPDRKKVKDLTYSYPAGAQAQAVADSLQAQWRANLGVTVKLDPVERTAFARARATCAYPLFRNSWEADYDHPHEWLSNLVVSGAAAGGACYSSSTVDRLIGDSDRARLTTALPGYKQAEQLLVQDVEYAALLYGVQPYLIKPYLRGAGGTALFDFYWSDAGVLRH
jgi:oligopeptide transport system substrate-binding protein